MTYGNVHDGNTSVFGLPSSRKYGRFTDSQIVDLPSTSSVTAQPQKTASSSASIPLCRFTNSPETSDVNINVEFNPFFAEK